MDLKDVLLGDEKSLPTLEQNLSTTTAPSSSLPTVTATPATYVKFGGSVALGIVGALLLAYGKKNNDVQKMILGAVMTLASFLLF
jgi:hypothetical protein